MSIPGYMKALLDAIAGDERFVMTVATHFVSTLVLVTGHISEGSYITLMLATVAMYIGGKVTESVSTTRSVTQVEQARSAARIAEAKSE